MSKVPKTVYDVVVATVADYNRMRKALEKGNLTKDQVASLTRKVAAIDDALLAICDGEDRDACEALRIDIGARNGFEHSKSIVYYGTKYVYNRRKSDAVEMMARMMDLI